MMLDTLKNQIVCIESGSRGKGGALTEGIPSLGAEHLQSDGNINWDPQKMKYISPSFFKTLKAGILQEGDVLVVKDGATTGKISYVSYLPSCAAINEHVFLLRTKSSLHSKFLFYYLQSSVGNQRIMEYYHGATVGGIGKNIVNIKIPLPPLNEQRHIAAVLDKVSDLIAKRRQQLDKLDELVKSRFIEMFVATDVASKWSYCTIADVSNDMRTGPFGSALHHDEFVDSGVFVLGIDNAVENKFSYNRMRYITEEKYQQLKRYTVYPGDVIITIMGTVGRSAVIPADMPKAINTKHLACITPNVEMVNAQFLSCAFQIHPGIRAQLQKQCKGAIMDGLNLTIIKGLSFRIPPINLQNHFVEFYEQTDKSKLTIQKSLEKLETLKKALMQKYFG